MVLGNYDFFAKRCSQQSACFAIGANFVNAFDTIVGDLLLIY